MPELDVVTDVVEDADDSKSTVSSDDEIAPAVAALDTKALEGIEQECAAKAKQSRMEKKARKILSKLGLKLVIFRNYCLKFFLNYTARATWYKN